jgi:hypothetical protein
MRLLFAAKYYNASPGTGPIYGLIIERRGRAAENFFGRNDRRGGISANILDFAPSAKAETGFRTGGQENRSVA